MQKGQLAEGEKTIADGENVQMNKPAKPYHYGTSRGCTKVQWRLLLVEIQGKKDKSCREV